MSECLLTPETRRTVVRLLRGGATVLMAAGAIGANDSTLLGWIRRGERERRFAHITRAHAQGCARNLREEQALATRAARLLLGGATVRSAAEQLGCSFSHLRGLVIRARGSDGRAPDRALAPLARPFPAQRFARKGLVKRPRCPTCGATLPVKPARRAAA